jgi:hypothetical protein
MSGVAEQPVGCALLCRKSLRQRLAAPLFFRLGLRDTADKTSDRQAYRDSHRSALSMSLIGKVRLTHPAGSWQVLR